MIKRQHPYSAPIRLAAIMLPVVMAFVVWSFSRPPTSGPDFSHRFAVSPAPLEALDVSETRLDRAGAAALLLMMLQTPLRDVPLMYSADASGISPSVLFAPPSRITAVDFSPRKLREIMDRGVIAFASSSSDLAQANAASLLQAAALAGYSPAGDLIARIYVQSAPVRSVVPAADVVRYALNGLAARGVDLDESTRVFTIVADYFASLDRIQDFAAYLIDALREDPATASAQRVRMILDSLEKVSGACVALGQAVSARGEVVDCNSSVADMLLKYVQSEGPILHQPELRRRALQMFDHIGITR